MAALTYLVCQRAAAPNRLRLAALEVVMCTEEIFSTLAQDAGFRLRLADELRVVLRSEVAARRVLFACGVLSHRSTQGRTVAPCPSVRPPRVPARPASAFEPSLRRLRDACDEAGARLHVFGLGHEWVPELRLRPGIHGRDPSCPFGGRVPRRDFAP